MADKFEATNEVRDEDDIFEELEREEDGVVSKFREQRLSELKKEAERLQEMRQNSYGTYDTIAIEKDVLSVTTSVKHCVVHFFHHDFRRCQIMDKHLAKLAEKHFMTRFIRIDVDNAPFLVEKLKIQILPCVVCFVDGISVDRVIGFQDLGQSDTFSTSLLENRLSKAGVIKLAVQLAKTRKTIYGFRDKKGDSDDEDYDSDE